MIELVAGLNVDDSAEQINKVDIPKLEKKLNAINIKCGITADSLNIKGLQQSINAAVKNTDVKINVGTDIKSSGINAQVKELEKALNISYPKGQTEELRKELKGLISDYQKAFQEEGGYGKQSESHMAKILEFATSYRQEIVHVNEDLKYTLDRIREIKKEQQQIFITADQKNALDDYAKKDGSTAKKMLDGALGATRWTSDPNKIKGAKPYYWSQFADEVNNINPFRDAIINENDIIQGIKDLAEITSKSFTEIDNSLDENGEKYAEWALHVMQSVGDVTKLSPFEQELTIDTTNDVIEVNELSEAFSNLDKTVKTTENDVSTFRYPDISIGKDTKETLANAKDVLNEAFSKNAGLAEDNANRIKRAVEDTSGELQRFYVQVEKGDKSVETLTYALNEQGDAYVYLGKTIREADNSTAFRRHDIATQWAEQTEKLKGFISKAEKAGAASTILGTEISNLKAKLAEGGDTSAMNAFLDDFDIAKAKLAAFNAEASKNNALKNLANRIRTLSADVNAYAESNKRAVESTKQMSNGNTFAAQWASIMSRMAKGAELSDREVKDLSADLRIFKKEAQAAGLTGATAFEKFANAFKLVSTYISANQIINMVTRQIRSAVSELQNMDDILTEISKTSDRTDESLRALGSSSFDVASSYGRTASDYLLGVQEMSRAGFGEKQSETLSELSLKAQAAGDMTAEMANQYIIATNAAYSLEGSEQKLNAVLDSQNYITNRNAVNMESLAEATKIAASQAAASGVDISELTSAVGTMIATTQQGGEIAGRAFKGKRVINTIARHRCESMIA